MKNINNQNAKRIIGILLLACIAVVGIIFGIHKSSDDNSGSNDVNSSENATDTVSENGDNGADCIEEYVENTDIYVNSGAITATDGAGGTLSVGTAAENVGGIVINPVYSNSTYNRVGFYISNSEEASLLYSQESYLDTETAATANNVMIDWTYDKLKSVKYVSDEDYGMCWNLQIDDPAITTSYVRLVVVNLNNHNIISSFTAEIGRNTNNKFQITSVYDNDISHIPFDKANIIWNSNINEEEEAAAKADAEEHELVYEEPAKLSDYDLNELRQQLVDAALNEINSENYISVIESFRTDTAVVELTNMTYHMNFLTPEHKLGYTGRITYPVWAVTINSTMSDIGHYTFYFAKENPSLCYGGDFIYLEDEATLNGEMGVKN